MTNEFNDKSMQGAIRRATAAYRKSCSAVERKRGESCTDLVLEITDLNCSTTGSETANLTKMIAPMAIDAKVATSIFSSRFSGGGDDVNSSILMLPTPLKISDAPSFPLRARAALVGDGARLTVRSSLTGDRQGCGRFSILSSCRRLRSSDSSSLGARSPGLYRRTGCAARGSPPPA